MDLAISLHNAKYKHFTGSTTSHVTLTALTKILFIQLDFTTHECGGAIGVSDYREADFTNGPVNGVVGKPFY